MKDKKSLLALILLIILMGILIAISLDNKAESAKRDKLIQKNSEAIQRLESNQEILKPIKGKDGRTPIKGIDYNDGAKGDRGEQGPKGDKGETGSTGKSGADGEKGEKGDTGERGASIDLECVKGVIAKKFSADSLWKLTNIKCEVTNE